MAEQTYLERLEEELKDLMIKAVEELEDSEIEKIDKKKKEVAEKLVLWHTVNGSKMFHFDKL